MAPGADLIAAIFFCGRGGRPTVGTELLKELRARADIHPIGKFGAVWRWMRLRLRGKR